MIPISDPQLKVRSAVGSDPRRAAGDPPAADLPVIAKFDHLTRTVKSAHWDGTNGYRRTTGVAAPL
jgi:hypothetical protein